MKDKNEKPTNITHGADAFGAPVYKVPRAYGLDPSTVWIGRDAMRHIIESASRRLDGYFPYQSPDIDSAGLRFIEHLLFELQEITGLRLRLIFGPPVAPLGELEVADPGPSQGTFEMSEVQKWVKAGAALVADANEKSGRPRDHRGPGIDSEN